MFRYYKVPLVDGIFRHPNGDTFTEEDYDTIEQGIAYQKQVDDGFGYIMTETEYSFEKVTCEKFESEKEV